MTICRAFVGRPASTIVLTIQNSYCVNIIQRYSAPRSYAKRFGWSTWYTNLSSSQS